MNSFERNAEKDKTTALLLTILVHAAIFAAIFFLGAPGNSTEATLKPKVDHPITQTIPKA